MFVFKMGKTKHKFKLRFIIAKFKYEPESEIKKNCLFKIKVTRGSHQIQVFSVPVKKGTIKFPKTQFMIPMTLFYDESDQVYLEKQAEVKTYLCDQNGNIERSIGKTALNIADYANRQKFGLEVEIQGENKKAKQQALITFQMTLERQDDDSKSVGTMSEDQVQFRSKQLNKAKQKQRSKSKQKNNFLFPIAQSNVSVKSAQQKLKDSFVSEADQKYSEQTKKQTKRCKRQKSPIRHLDQIKQGENRQKSEGEEQDQFFSEFVNRQKQAKKQKNDSQFQAIWREGKNNLDNYQRQGKQKFGKQEQGNSRQNLIRKGEQSQNRLVNGNLQESQRNNSSVDLKLHLATKKISTLQRQNNQLKNQKNRMKEIVEQLLQQKGKKQMNQSTTNNESKQQIQYFKKIIIQKEMKINELESLNKLIVQRQQTKERQLKQNKNQIKELKLKLQYEKNKLAKVLQTAMESQNVDLLEIIQKELSDEFY